MNALIARWVNNDEEQLTLLEDDHEIILQRQLRAVRVRVQLTRHRPENARLQSWARLGEASLNHFPGALAQDPASGALWLVRYLPDGTDADAVLSNVAQLLNQRDTWCAVAARQAMPAQKRPYSRLSTLTL